ncbi:hypothetical protein [Candidatus Methylocalor cossyra]|uniref:Uncharacterized protein n=1 Tax=Candidatus Methylocalor cossyra TaxID=3108543 RepID=A0ABM9NI26_9GAMM
MGTGLLAIKQDLQALVEAFQAGGNDRRAAWRSYKDLVYGQLHSAEHGAAWSAITRARAANEATYGAAVADLFDYMLCAEAMLGTVDAIESLNVPDAVKQLVVDEFDSRRRDGLDGRHQDYALNRKEGLHQLKKSQLSLLPLGLYTTRSAASRRSIWSSARHPRRRAWSGIWPCT